MKVSRHAKIIELISQYDIETQEELAEYLNNAGFKVTQATVSRDIRDLKLSKVSYRKRTSEIYSSPDQNEPAMSEKYIRSSRRLCVDGHGAEYSSNQNRVRYGNGGGGRGRRNEMA